MLSISKKKINLFYENVVSVPGKEGILLRHEGSLQYQVWSTGDWTQVGVLSETRPTLHLPTNQSWKQIYIYIYRKLALLNS